MFILLVDIGRAFHVFTLAATVMELSIEIVLLPSCFYKTNRRRWKANIYTKINALNVSKYT